MTIKKHLETMNKEQGRTFLEMILTGYYGTRFFELKHNIPRYYDFGYHGIFKLQWDTIKSKWIYEWIEFFIDSDEILEEEYE